MTSATASRIASLIRLGSFLVSGQPAGDRSGDELDGHQARLLAGLLAPHAVGHDEQIGRLERQRGISLLLSEPLSCRTDRRPGTKKLSSLCSR